MDDLEGNEKKYIVSGQILELKPAPTSVGPQKEVDWMWTGQYIRYGAKSAEKQSSNCQYIVCIPGKLIHPLEPSVVPTPKDWMDEEGEIPQCYLVYYKSTTYRDLGLGMGCIQSRH
jgi:hypothetical protein